MEEQSRLLRLPRELRDEIIRHVFDSFSLERLDFNRHHDVQERIVTTPIKSLPPICIASQQLYDETTPYFLTRIMPISFNVSTTCWIRRWLATFPSGSGYRSICNMSFRNFHGPEQIKGYELVSMLPNLKYLFVMLGDEYSDPGTVPSLAISSLSSSVNAYENLDNIILMHQLHKLTDLPSLEVLEFGFHDWEQPMSHDRARQVKEWLDVKFRARGKEVSIVCKQMQWGGMYSANDVDEIAMQWYDASTLDVVVDEQRV
ncbi:hypothetical protein CC86DRAFT_368104 [Ophiobolus disseminans]|uniref:F-box domain-containing protein n=1 Tax=Ophiobolus disseminans TaxID=1469910 RepID=A0A6A7A710_9PLEO|nr:hypothetical protein CC86DRAFT_368104 [Ophiobolus disseminans]